MSDAFIDNLFETLNVERKKTLVAAATAIESRERVGEAARAWWCEFCEVLDRKVQAWNAKDAAEARVAHTRTPSGSIRLWHRSAEVELSLAEPRVVMTGRIGDTRPRESPFIEFNDSRAGVTATLTGEHGAKSPSEAADHLLAPILTRAFSG